MPQADIVALIKPQFEAGKQEASKGKGVIRDPEIWNRVLHETIAAVTMMAVAIQDVLETEPEGGCHGAPSGRRSPRCSGCLIAMGCRGDPDGRRDPGGS